MEHYAPPYTVTDEMLTLVANISEKVGRIGSRYDPEARPHLRRSSRIRSIHASLKIEANSLSLSEVRDVINGRTVRGDRNEIREVKNAYSAYEKLPELDPFSLADLKKAHALMTEDLVAESGAFRRGNEGVFADGKCIFVAPPPDMVTGLTEDLLRWMRESASTVHPLILSAVFHYEFVFIHPFSDGNGRMARLWHTLILSRWRSVFAYLPIESRIEIFQNEYYDSIARCHVNGNSDVFILFMLRQIDAALEELLGTLDGENMELSGYVRKMLAVMEPDLPYSTSEIMERLGLKSRETFRKNYMAPALQLGVVEMTIPDKPQSKNQKYVRK